MKKLTLLLLTLAPSIAYADQAGASLEILPSGTLTLKGNVPIFGNVSTSTAAKTAIGFGLTADHDVGPLFSLGFAPRFFFGVKSNDPNDNSDAGDELDLRLRATVGKEVAAKVRPYIYVTPGYSILFMPNGNGGSNHPHGFAIGLGGGVSYDVTTSLRGFFELGYQWGFQGGTYKVLNSDQHYDFETQYFGLAIGVSSEVK